jgi:urea transport system ATP-binding protein
MLILDEPTEGIQPNVVQQIGEVIQYLNQQEKLTVLLVEQKLPFARKFAQRFSIMEKGRAVAAGMIDQLNDDIVQTHLAV